MKIVLLDAKTLGKDLDLSCLETFGDLCIYQTTTYEETYERIKDATIVITNKVVIDAQLLELTPKLQLICVAATGMNNVDLEAAKNNQVVVKNVAGYSTRSVVQHTFSMALYLLEKMAYYDHYVQSGAWTKSELFTDVSHPFYEIAGKKWALSGWVGLVRR